MTNKLRVLQMIDDQGLHPTVKLTCDCGWTEKAHADREARNRAENHLRVNHSGGIMRYLGHSYQI